MWKKKCFWTHTHTPNEYCHFYEYVQQEAISQKNRLLTEKPILSSRLLLLLLLLLICCFFYISLSFVRCAFWIFSRFFKLFSLFYLQSVWTKSMVFDRKSQKKDVETTHNLWGQRTLTFARSNSIFVHFRFYFLDNIRCRLFDKLMMRFDFKKKKNSMEIRLIRQNFNRFKSVAIFIKPILSCISEYFKVIRENPATIFMTIKKCVLWMAQVIVFRHFLSKCI